MSDSSGDGGCPPLVDSSSEDKPQVKSDSEDEAVSDEEFDAVFGGCVLLGFPYGLLRKVERRHSFIVRLASVRCIPLWHH